MLEAGSGAGRFTEDPLLAAGAELHSFDFSSAVEANRANNGASDRLTLAQADIRRIPFAPQSYDYVVCLGVLQHTPSPEESIASLWRMVKPGGRLIIDHYRYRLRFRLPTPVGDAGSLYRWITLSIAGAVALQLRQAGHRFLVSGALALQKVAVCSAHDPTSLAVRFYYPNVPLRDRQMHYEWSLLDTHDSTTDYYKHLRSVDQIRSALEGLGAQEIVVTVGGNGVEAYCVKPMMRGPADVA